MEWFRVYQSDVDDVTLQLLPTEVFKFYANLRCLANYGDGILPPMATIMYRCHKGQAEVEEYLEELQQAGLLSEIAPGTLVLTRWKDEQKPSDKSAKRVEAYRLRQREEALSKCRNVTASLPHRYSNGLEKRREEEKREEIPASADACVPVADPAPKPQKPKSALRIQQESWFNTFWADYWRKKDKEPAWAAFRNLITSESAFNALMGAVSRDRAEMLRRKIETRPYGASYLNKKPWMDGDEESPEPRTGKTASVFRESFAADEPPPIPPEREKELQSMLSDSDATIRHLAQIALGMVH